MGQYANAELAFGLWIPGSEDYEPENPAYQWQEKLNELHEDDDEWEGTGEYLWDLIERGDGEKPLTIVFGGHHDFHSYILAIPETHAQAYGYQIVSIDLPAIAAAVTPERVEAAKQFCIDNDLPSFEPKWWLIPSFG